MTQDAYELTILMPCLNEAETLETCIRKAQSYLEKSRICGEVVIADNGSSDGSRQIAARLGARVVPVETRGYGAALLGGTHAAQGRYIIMGDADDSYDFTALDPFVHQLRQGYDLVMGNRFKGGIRPGAMPFLHRYVGNPILSAIGRLFFRASIGDFHCGLRAYRRQAILDLDLQTTGMEFASEMIVKASMAGLKIAEVPTILYPDGRSRPPHLRTWSDGWRHLRFLLLYSPRWLFLYPGLLLMLAGLLLGGWLLPGTQVFLGLKLDINTLFYAALMVIIGFQAVNFAAFTKIFGIQARLLPPDPVLEKTLSWLRLERSLLLGAVMVASGLGMSLVAVADWEGRGFGPLNPAQSLRLVIPGGALLALGFQTMFSAFFLSILALRRR